MTVLCPRCDLPIDPPNEEDDVACPCCGAYVRAAVPTWWDQNVKRIAWVVGVIALLILILIMSY